MAKHLIKKGTFLLLCLTIILSSQMFVPAQKSLAQDVQISQATIWDALLCWAQDSMGWDRSEFDSRTISESNHLDYQLRKGVNETGIKYFTGGSEKAFDWMQAKYSDSQSWEYPYEWTDFHGLEALNRSGEPPSYWRYNQLVFYAWGIGWTTAGHEALWQCAQTSGLFDKIEPPKAVFTYTLISDTEIAFDASGSTGGSPEISGYQWDFGDGSTEWDIIKPKHTYTSAGEYTVSLTVMDPAGNRDTTSQKIDFSQAGGETYLEITADTESLSPDGSSSTEITVTITRNGYPVPGEKVDFRINDERNLLDDDGKLSATSGVTDSQGKLKTTYTAPLVEDSAFGAATISIQAVHPSGNPKVSITIAGGLVLQVQTDKNQYEQGEAITLTGELIYGGRPAALKNIQNLKNNLSIELLVPNTDSSVAGRTISGLETDDNGKFTFIPFAGWNTGEYTINTKANLWVEPIEGYVSAEFPVKISVTQATVADDIKPQLDQIIALYKSTIPNGPIWDDPPTGWPESMYGTYHNLFLAGTRADPGSRFACGGYQDQSLSFFDSLRFSSDPARRALLKGLDYGPVARGAVYLGGHHAAVLYPIGKDWKGTSEEWTGQSVIFDPWGSQKAATTTVTSFTGGWGFPRPDGYYNANPDQTFTGYPFTGGSIYVNWSIAQKARAKVPTPKNSIALRCPVSLQITNDQGQNIGMYPDGTYVQEFEADIYYFTDENDQPLGWYAGLPEGNYQTAITGQDSGTFQLWVKGEVSDGKVLDYGEQPVQKGEQSNIYLTPEYPTTRLILADGTQISPAVTETDDGDELSKGKLIGIAVATLVLALFLAIVLKFLPLRFRLLLFLIIFIGGTIGGILLAGHDFDDVKDTIENWSGDDE